MEILDTNFTYGVEIEGIFYKSIEKPLYELDIEAITKHDSSIGVNSISRKSKIDWDQVIGGEETQHTEVNMGVFYNIDDIVKALKVFKNGENYFSDSSCGLHLHVKPRVMIKESKELFWDLPFIKKLEKFAFTELCECIKSRKGNRYCEAYGNFNSFYHDYQGESKYRFVRNHPSGTMEFRFFSPCEHKTDNLKKFLNYMFEELGKQEHTKSETITLELDEIIVSTDNNFKLGVAENRDYDYTLGEPVTSEYTDCDCHDDEDHDFDPYCECGGCEHDYDSDCDCSTCQEISDENNDDR